MEQGSPDFYNPIQYSIIKRPFFRFEFPGLDEIQINFSQLHQDMFVLCALGGKRGGSYLEIGAHEPMFISNTFLLEQQFGWNGLGLELDEKMVKRHKKLRRSHCIQCDALALDYEKCLEAEGMPRIIDYLSLDIDPPENSLKALLCLPHQKYRFRVITFEHDLSFGGRIERLESRRFLQELGYELVLGDVSWQNHVVEDWWVDPSLTDPDIIKNLRPSEASGIHPHDKYFYESILGTQDARGNTPDVLNSAEMPLSKGICIEGWRDLNHSYSLVNQWQLLELLKHSIRLRHLDIPPINPQWDSRSNGSGLPDELAEKVKEIQAPEADDYFSAIYRITFPMNLHEGRADRLVIFGTAGDFNGIPYRGGTPEEACKRGNVTIVTPSNWSKSAFVELGFMEECIRVIPHGINASCFYPVEEELRSLYRQVLGIHPEDFALLHLGALTPMKGVDMLLRAFANLKQRHKNLKLIIKDQSNLYKRTLRDVVRELENSGRPLALSEEGWNDVISLSENLDVGGLRALYNSCDLFVSPYRAEGFNLPPLEAAACGMPILITAGGATDDYYSPQLGLQIASKIIGQGLETYLEPDQESLEEAICAIMRSPNNWGGSRGSEIVTRNYHWKGIGDRLCRLMAEG